MPRGRSGFQANPLVNAAAPPAVDLRTYQRGGAGSLARAGGAYGPAGMQAFPGGIPALGNISTVPCIVGTADAIFLERPSTTRIFLFVRNIDAANTVSLAWDVPASTVAGSGSMDFLPGDSFNFMDFVPQNDLHLIASGAGTNFLIWYCNANLTPFA